MVEPIQVKPDAVSGLDIASAVDGARPGNLFPSGVAWIASQGNPRFIRVVEGELAHGYRLRPIEIVRVPKQDRTTRPAADMPQRDQLVYTALVSALREAIPPEYVTFTGEGEEGQSYREFEEFPLSVQGTQYVVEADAAAFYQYIDHERLAYELIGLTGMAHVSEVLVSALEGWMESSHGLPQGPKASQPLADIYIAPAARAMARAGFAVSRYSDDFRIPSASWADAVRAQQALEDAFYAIGLAVAPRKLKTPRIETYRRQLTQANDPRVTGQASIAALRAMENEEYFAGDWDVAVVDAQQVINAAQVLAEQMEVLPVSVTSMRLVRRSIGILGAGRSPVGLQSLGRLLDRYPNLTPNICSYLRAILSSPAEADVVLAVSDQLRSRELRSGWQVGWLLHVLSLAATSRGEVAELVRPHISNETLPWFARAAAARAVAVHGPLPSLDEYFGVYERATEAARPDLVAAVVVANPTWMARFVSGIGGDPLLTDITEFAGEDVRAWF